jgi:DNA (cytosine-5)-methyltransferase 1
VNVLSLFSGIGGLELGLERAGMTVVGQVEIDPFCRRVLAKHWPEVPRHDDVRTCLSWWRSEPRPVVDVVAGGYPCQPDSLAGRRLGERDHRWLWPQMAEVIDEIRPAVVIGENVPGHRARGLPTVLDDLARLGYHARTGVARACEVGAPHPRARLFILAHADRPGFEPWSGLEPAGAPAVGTGWWTGEPDLARMAHGVPAGVDRRRALGNAVVPQVAEHIGRLVMAADPRPGPDPNPAGPTGPQPTHPPSMPPPAPVPVKTSTLVPARSVAPVEAASMRRYAGTPARAGDLRGDLARAGTQTPAVVVGSGGGGFQPTPKGST